MSIPKTFFIILIGTFLTSVSAEAQTLKQLIKAGDQKFDDGDYYAASLYYKDALKKDEDNTEVNYKFAEASRMFNDYAGASQGYSRVVKNDASGQYPLALFWQAEMVRSTCVCKTEDALRLLKRFKNRYHKKDFFAAKAQQEIESCNWVLNNKAVVDSIQIEHLGKDVNTTNSEFNAIFVAPDKIQFSSLRNISDDKKHEKYLVRLYNQPPNPQTIFMPEGSSPDLNIGNGAYSPDIKRFYFTQCEQKDKTSTRCDIYVSKYENFKWTPAAKLDSVNDPNSTNTQPSLGYDTKGNEVLFFSSDRPGGKGGMDIWASKISKDGKYTAPVNLGDKINTPGNEITPFYDVNNKKLYFSSDWLYGYGGYDIFETKQDAIGWSTPKNVLQPINSPQNDLYYSLALNDSKAYITSNRKGSYFIEAETCCNDIYAYNTGRKVDRRFDTASTAKRDTMQVVKLETTNKPDTLVAVNNVDTSTITRVETPPTPPVAEVHTEMPKLIDANIKKIKQLLPVTLYFHNDEPDCCNLSDTTKLDYKQTYEGYSALLNDYKKEFSKGLKANEKVSAEGEIFTLFTQKVDKGFYDLVAFSSQLLDILKDGNKVEITIKGYCSPLNYNLYNIKLGYRRVASLRNYFFHYRNGMLMPYIANGSLVLKSESLGEETAPKTVSDNREDTRNSVYNPAAAAERRVEIISVELK